MRHVVARALLLALLAVGCGATETDEPSGDGRQSAPSRTPEPHACEAAAGAVTDVAGEPDWRRWADYRPWTTADGCLVRIDVLADRSGPAHCGYESARVIITGKPVGTHYGGSESSAEYVRDPESVFGDSATAAAFDADADLPESAVATGFRQETTELWIDPSDSSSIYLVSEGSVERWPLDPEPTLCR
jgi:hypothetical protein